MNIPRVLSGKYKEDETRNLVSGKTLKVIDKYNPQDKRIHGTWIIQGSRWTREEKKIFNEVYTKEKFIEICKKVGLSNFETYSDWNKTPYSEDSEDMIIIAKK